MDAPTVACENKFKLKNKDSSYTLYLANESNSLVIKITEDDSIPLRTFSETFSLNDLTKENRYFKFFETIDEIIIEFQNLMEDNKVEFSVETSVFLLILHLSLKVIEEVKLSIPQKNINSKDIISELCSSLNDLRKKVKYLENQMISKISEEKLKESLISKEIILNEEEEKMIKNWILKKLNKENSKIELNLLYKLTRDGDGCSTFHTKCDGKGPTIIIIQTTSGYKFGGYTSINWDNTTNNYKKDELAFIFSLNKKKKYKIKSEKIGNAIWSGSNYGPIFGSGHDFYISNNCKSSSSGTNTPYSYECDEKNGLTGGQRNFYVKEMEVFQVEFI